MGFASESSGIGTAGRGLSFGFATRCFSGNMAYDMMVGFSHVMEILGLRVNSY